PIKERSCGGLRHRTERSGRRDLREDRAHSGIGQGRAISGGERCVGLVAYRLKNQTGTPPLGPRSGTFREPADQGALAARTLSARVPLPELAAAPADRISDFRPKRAELHFISTVAPASSSFFFTAAASSLPMFSFTALGAPSTRSLASLSPRPVSSRTVLITLIFDAPASFRITVNSVFSSASAGAADPPAPPPAAATATGAADTPQRSCRYLPNCAISRIDQASSSPATFSNLGFSELSLTAVAIFLSFLLRAVRLKHADEISLSRCEHSDDLSERCLQRPDERGLQLRAGGKTRERRHIVSAHRATADERAEDLQRLEHAGLVDEALRELDLVAFADRDRGRPGEHRAQLALPGLLRGAREQAVLHDVVLDAPRA